MSGKYTPRVKDCSIFKEIALNTGCKNKGKNNPMVNYNVVEMEQMSLFDTVKDDDIITELKDLDLGNMTPIDALNTLYKLQNKLKNRW